MIFAIRDGEMPSQKTRFTIKLIESTFKKPVILISRKGVTVSGKLAARNIIELPTSTTGIFAYYLFMIVKSPKDLSIGLQSRLLNKPRPVSLMGEGFLSMLAQVLFYYFSAKGKTLPLSKFLKKQNCANIFIIDEFLSVNTVSMKMLKQFGSIVYISQDVAYNRYGFQDSVIARSLMYKIEKEAIAVSDLVIASSERDRLKYVAMGAKKSTFYPNIYPISDFQPCAKDTYPSIVIVSRGHWGAQANKSLEGIFKGLSYLNQRIKVYVIGIKPKNIPKNLIIHHYEFFPKKLDYLNVLSRSWIGINIGFHLAGTNERKYDYAMAQQVVFSDSIGARGDLLPYEYVFVDPEDFAAKLKQLLQVGRDNLLVMGTKNREQALLLAEVQYQQLKEEINSLVLSRNTKHNCS